MYSNPHIIPQWHVLSSKQIDTLFDFFEYMFNFDFAVMAEDFKEGYTNPEELQVTIEYLYCIYQMLYWEMKWNENISQQKREKLKEYMCEIVDFNKDHKLGLKIIILDEMNF